MRFVYSIVILSGLILIGTSAWAQRDNTAENLKKVESLSSQAAIAFDKGDYNRAYKLYSEAHKLFRDPRLTFAMLRCLESMKRYDEALKMVKQGLSEHPDPVLRSRFKSREAHLRELLSKGTLKLKVIPWGAVIKIDGKAIGKSPINPVVLSAGKHTVEIWKKGYKRVRKVIQVPGGRVVSKDMVLHEVTGRLSVTTRPNSAKLYVDGKFVGNTPLEGLEIPAGHHRLSFRAPGMMSQTREITVKPGVLVHVDVFMVKTVAVPGPRIKKGAWYRSWPGWVSLGLGLGLGIGGGVLLHKASHDHNTVNSALDEVRNSVNSGKISLVYSQAQLQDMWSRANSNEKIGYGLIVGAGVAVIASTVLFITRTGSSHGNARKKTASMPIPFCTTEGIGVFMNFR